MNNEQRRLHLENRIHLLSAKPVENARLIKKAERQLRQLDKS